MQVGIRAVKMKKGHAHFMRDKVREMGTVTEDGQARSTEKRKPFFIIAFQRSFEKDKWRNREYGNRKRVIL